MTGTIGSPKYPDLVVAISEGDGNAFAVLGTCFRAMRRAGLDQAERDAFKEEATSGDYEHLLQTCFRWFDVE